MGLLADIFSNFVGRNPKKFLDVKSSYIFYKIVDSVENEEYTLQCINTNAIFHANIYDMVFDLDILHGLHPIQACYIGIEYAKYIKRFVPPLEIKKIHNNNITKYSVSRYGCYHLCYQNRNGDLAFTNIMTDEEFIMDSRDIALSEELIGEFDSAQAFYIGLTAGIKINNPVKKLDMPRPHLRIVT